jgi:hypothetical protein
MSELGDPPRLFEDGSLDPALRQALDVVRRDSLSLEEAQLWAERAVQNLPNATQGGTASVFKSLWVKLGALVVVVGSGLVWMQAGHSPRSVTEGAPVVALGLESEQADRGARSAGGVAGRPRSDERTDLQVRVAEPDGEAGVESQHRAADHPGEGAGEPARDPSNESGTVAARAAGNARVAPRQPPLEKRPPPQAIGGRRASTSPRALLARALPTSPGPATASRAKSGHTPSSSYEAEAAHSPQVGSVPSEDSGADAELALLMRAQQSAAVSPERCLTLLETHRRTYPDGAFAEERDALKIDVLHLLRVKAHGSAQEPADTALRREVRDFLARYPRSPHRARIARLVREMSADPAGATSTAP